jgi:hypothetical protein
VFYGHYLILIVPRHIGMASIKIILYRSHLNVTQALVTPSGERNCLPDEPQRWIHIDLMNNLNTCYVHFTALFVRKTVNLPLKKLEHERNISSEENCYNPMKLESRGRNVKHTKRNLPTMKKYFGPFLFHYKQVSLFSRKRE